MTSTSAAAARTAPTDPLHRPDLWSFEPSLTYLNHGGFGAVPLPVLAEQARWKERMERNPTRFFRSLLQPALDRSRVALAGFVGAGRPDLLEGTALVVNASAGASAVFASFPLRTGDRILTTDHGYGAVLYAAQASAGRAGAFVDRVHVPLGAGDEDTVAAITGAVGERTVLAVVDHIASPTAKVFPVRRIVRALHERGVAVLVDAAHAPGAVPVDLERLRPDFWAGNLHKWSSAPRGTGLLYVAPQYRGWMRAFPVSWREPEGYPHAFTQHGTGDHTAWLAAPSVLELFGGFGWSAVLERNAALAEYGQAVVADAVGADLGLVGAAPAPMRVIPLPGVSGGQPEADALRDVLADRHGFEVALNAWDGLMLLRVSAQLYNDATQFDRLAVALRGELAR